MVLLLVAVIRPAAVARAVAVICSIASRVQVVVVIMVVLVMVVLPTMLGEIVTPTPNDALPLHRRQKQRRGRFKRHL